MNNEATYESKGLDLIQIWKVVRLKKWWIIAFCVIVSSVSFQFISAMPPVYTATVEILVGAKQAKTVAIRDVYSAEDNASYRFNPYLTQMKVMQSRELLEKVIDRLHLLERPEFVKKLANLQRIKTFFGLDGDSEAVIDITHRENIVQSLKENLALKNIPSTGLIDITYESESSELAAGVPNMLAQIYIETENTFRNNKISEATHWMEGRTVILKSKFEKAQLEFQRYVEKERLFDISSGRNNRVGALSVDKFQALKEKVKEMDLYVSDLSLKFGAKHPELLSARNELMQARVELEKKKMEIFSLGRKNIKIQELKQKMETTKALYEKFFNRTSEALEAATLKINTVRIVESAVAPAYALASKKNKLMIAALFGSLFLGAFVVVLLDMMNSSIRSIRDVEEKLNLPVLGVLPILNSRLGKHPNVAFAMVEAVNASFSEAMSSIRTGLVLSGLDNPHKVILLTSSVPNEGKTTTAISLAISLGRLEKVLLIDSDMRKPSINLWCGISESKYGLSNFVSGSATLNDCIVRQESMGIDVMVAGQCPPNPLELLSSERFKRLLKVLEGHYDRIIIDSPPVQAVSDSLILSKYAKSVIYVVKVESTQTGVVKAGVDRMLRYNAPITGVVLNYFDVTKSVVHDDALSGCFDQYGYGEKAKR